jgi:hypothetical protein
VGQDDSQGQAHRHGGSRPVACDLVGFWRPRLSGGPTKPYGAQAGKALPAIPLGLTARVGSVGSQRLAIPCRLGRTAAEEPGEPALPRRLFQQTNVLLAAADVLVTERGFPLAPLQVAGIMWYVSRGPPHGTARRACPSPSRGTGRRPTRGPVVRPLPRTSKQPTLAATPPDRRETWQGGTPEALGIVCAPFWDNLVLPEAPPDAPTFPCMVIHAPRCAAPWLLNTPLPLSGAQAQAMYRDRWPVAGLPLGAKPRLGAARQFGFAPERRQRLPDVALLAGSLLAYTAATRPAVATGFWERAPRPTPGRLRRLLAQGHLPDVPELPQQLRQKPSPTAPLPTGVCGPR